MKMLEQLRDKYLELSKGVIDFEKFNHIAIVHHSSAIEGSTLTPLETEVLLTEGLTPKGKPLLHSLMAKDHLIALKEILKQADQKKPFTADDLKKIAGIVVKNEKGVVNAPLGSFDPTKGDLRLVNVRVGSSSFPDFKKVPRLFTQFINDIVNNIDKLKGFKEINDFAFEVHYQLVSIHPWADGNGRTSRLMMNYVQHYHKEPLSIVNSEDKTSYIEALKASRESKSTAPFKTFMYAQYEKHLSAEIALLSKKIEKGRSDLGIHFVF